MCVFQWTCACTFVFAPVCVYMYACVWMIFLARLGLYKLNVIASETWPIQCLQLWALTQAAVSCVTHHIKCSTHTHTRISEHTSSALIYAISTLDLHTLPWIIHVEASCKVTAAKLPCERMIPCMIAATVYHRFISGAVTRFDTALRYMLLSLRCPRCLL